MTPKKVWGGGLTGSSERGPKRTEELNAVEERDETKVKTRKQNPRELNKKKVGEDKRIYIRGRSREK